MTAGTSASLCWTLQFVSVFIFVSADQKTITAKTGQNVTLPCQAPNKNNPITAVEWTRADLGGEHVLLHREGRFDTESQHPSFKNRVDLQDRQMKEGNVSLILKNVTTADDGTYVCEVFQNTQDSFKVSIELSVVPPGPAGGDREDGGKDVSVGLTVGLSVSAVLLVAAAVIVLLIYRKRGQCQLCPASS